MKIANYFVLMLVSFISLSCSKFNQSDFQSFLNVNQGEFVWYGESSPAPDFNGIYTESKYFKILDYRLIKYTILDIAFPEESVKVYCIPDEDLFLDFVHGQIKTNLFNDSEPLTIDNMDDKSISLGNDKYKIDVVTSEDRLSLFEKAVPVSPRKYAQIIKELSSSR